MDLSAEGLTFRASPNYDVVLADRLGPAELKRLAVVDADDNYGALVPRPGSDRKLRALSRDLALLLLTLTQPGPIPRYVQRSLGSQTEPTLRRLVLDGVLQVRLGDGFVDGVRAGELLAELTGQGEDEVDDLGQAALVYAQDLARWLDEDELAGRLYRYGRVPLSPGLLAKLGGANAQPFQGPRRHFAATLARSGWIPIGTGEQAPWQEWAAPAASAHARPDRDRCMYKLYLSPSVDQVGEVLLGAIPALLATRGVIGFKIGNEPGGVCRPDKMVAYLGDRDCLAVLADRLAADLAGAQAHGVAFTAPVTADRLLSWGMDTPVQSGSARRMSWRQWVTANLAHGLREALAQTQTPPLSGGDPWRHAVRRIRLAGVDTGTWTPTELYWQRGVDAR